MELNLALVMLLVGAVILAIGFFRGYRSRDVRTAMNIVGVILVAVPLLVWGNVINLPAITKPLAVSAPQITTTTQQLPIATSTLSKVTCPVEDTTVTLSAQDKYTAAATGGYHRYRICDSTGSCSPAKVVSDGGTFTASPGDVIETLFYNGSATGYFSDYKKEVIPCVGTKVISTELVQNGSLTVQVWNEDGDLIDGVSNNESLDAGEVVSLDMKLKGQYKKEFPYGLVVVVEYNKTTVDDVVISLDGNELPKTTVPQSYSGSYGSDSAKVAYEVPPIVSNQILSSSITIDADDNNEPTVSANGSSSNILLTFYPKNYFINEDKSGSVDGPAVEDEDNTLTRAGGFSYTLYIM